MIDTLTPLNIIGSLHWAGREVRLINDVSDSCRADPQITALPPPSKGSQECWTHIHEREALAPFDTIVMPRGTTLDPDAPMSRPPARYQTSIQLVTQIHHFCPYRGKTEGTQGVHCVCVDQ